MAAFPNERQQQAIDRERRSRIGHWGLLNAIYQNLQLGNRAAEGRLQDKTPFDIAPFGSTTINVSEEQRSSSLPQVAVTALALGAGGLGLANLAGLIGQPEPTPVVQPEKPEPQTPQEIPLEIDYEFIPRIDGGGPAE